jgi:hypothetical protein
LVGWLVQPMGHGAQDLHGRCVGWFGCVTLIQFQILYTKQSQILYTSFPQFGTRRLCVLAFMCSIMRAYEKFLTSFAWISSGENCPTDLLFCSSGTHNDNVTRRHKTYTSNKTCIAYFWSNDVISRLCSA